MTITQTIERLERLDPQRAAINAINQTKEQYEALQRDQFSKGRTKDGANIEPGPYTPGYAKKRQKKGLQTDFIDLNFSGAYYEKMTMEVDGSVIKLGSDVDYEKYISKRYDGPGELYGLTEENMNKYREIVRPLIQMEVKAQYGNV